MSRLGWGSVSVSRPLSAEEIKAAEPKSDPADVIAEEWRALDRQYAEPWTLGDTRTWKEA